VITTSFEDATAQPFDICVIGSGPVGLAVALELQRLGRTVLVLEAGGAEQTAPAQALSDHDVVDPSVHYDPRTAVARRLGGSSNLWGGRCTPFRAIDLETRAWISGADWPITIDDLTPFYAGAYAHLDAGDAVAESPVPGVTPVGGDFRSDTVERFSNRFQSQRRHAEALRASPDVRVLLNVAVTGLGFAQDGAIASLDLRLSDGRAHVLPVRRVVLAAGGNESARMLLVAQRAAPERFGGADGPLGRFYMAHVNGSIADIVFTTPQQDAAFDFFIDAHGGYARRRITPTPELQRAEQLLNVAFYPKVHDVADPRHGSGLLSLAYLALSIGPLGRLVIAEAIRRRQVGDQVRDVHRHLWNVLREPLRVAGFAPWFLWSRRYARHRLPGFYIRNRNRRYGLEYHSEQSPNPDSRLTLSDRIDATGQPLLRIDYRVAREDAERVVRAHDLLARWLDRTGVGRLEHRHPADRRIDAVMEEVFHGTHQIGTIRMAATPDKGVVDSTLAVFGAPGLYVASSAVFPTSGHASPTLTAVALGLRLAQHLARLN